ncbi:MAG TPA: hypothetical protein PLM33_02445 [Acidobacteriota bacterium]|jgi:hypothetical protein|nr:hypothetical protein [Acidobacteriota bacterium]HRR25918.1 hypothetical protein [Acidobacteriota bacterium]HRR56232.1 hypothetical protein [Acidobacteriota bacterium]HRV08204.1 hypothetical protein [Acidobacteriota bacterium]
MTLLGNEVTASDPVQDIYRRGWYVAGCLVLLSGLLYGSRGLLGTGFGAILGGVGFRWLGRLVDRLLKDPGRVKPGRLVIGFVGRFVLICLGAFAIIQTSLVTGLAILAGMASFVIAGMMEAVVLLIRK